MLRLAYACLILELLVMAKNSTLKSQDKPGAVHLPDTLLTDGDIQFYHFQQIDMTVCAFSSGFDFIYIGQKPGTVSQIAKQKNYRLLINASFFDGDREQATHAGWLKIFGAQLAPLKIDRQLSHVVKYQPADARFEFTDYQNFKPDTATNSIEFQTGPLIIENNLIAENYIRTSINGMGKYRRTLLGTTDDGKMYFIIVRSQIALDELAQFLLTVSAFAGKNLSVINLDGGPSVALYVKKYPQFNYNTSARLPLLLGVF